MIQIFTGPDAERESVLYGALSNIPVIRVSDGLRTAAAVLGLNSTRPISEVWQKLGKDIAIESRCMVGDVPDSIVLEALMKKYNEIHDWGNKFYDVELRFKPMPIPPGKLELDRAGLAADVLLKFNKIPDDPCREELKNLLRPLAVSA